MNFHKPHSEVYVPDGAEAKAALARATHLAIGAHPDDNEIMAWHGILECFGQEGRRFAGVTVTNGAGSARDGIYARYTDEEMQRTRRAEQKKAAFVGEYAAQVFLDYTSGEVKEPQSAWVAEDLKQVVEAVRPQLIYTHNLADKHDTHVAVALRTIAALRALAPETRPQRLYGCEVWRSLDWLNDDDKMIFNVEGRENLAMSLVGIFDSQICGGKRYDLATWGRRRANATYLESHAVDRTAAVIYALELTPLIQNDRLDPAEFTAGFLERFQRDVCARITRLKGVQKGNPSS